MLFLLKKTVHTHAHNLDYTPDHWLTQPYVFSLSEQIQSTNNTTQMHRLQFYSCLSPKNHFARSEYMKRCRETLSYHYYLVLQAHEFLNLSICIARSSNHISKTTLSVCTIFVMSEANSLTGALMLSGKQSVAAIRCCRFCRNMVRNQTNKKQNVDSKSEFLHFLFEELTKFRE